MILEDIYFTVIGDDWGAYVLKRTRHPRYVYGESPRKTVYDSIQAPEGGQYSFFMWCLNIWDWDNPREIFNPMNTKGLPGL